MQYDPIKNQLAKLLGSSLLKRCLFFMALDILFLRAWYVRRELRWLKSRIKIQNSKFKIQHSTILDAGMGFGQYSDRMLRMFKGARLVGLEIDRKHIYGSENYFRRIHPRAHIVVGDVQVQPFAAGKFDIALTVDVMEHVEDDEATFAEYYRVLKPGGYLLMHTPRVVENDPPLPPPTSQGGIGSDPPLPPPAIAGGVDGRWRVDEHVRDGYSDSEARESLEAAGLKVVKIVRGYGWAGRTAWKLLQRVPLSMLSKGKIMMLPAAIYMIAAFPVGLLFMWLDMMLGDDPHGGSLLVVAQRPEGT